MPFDQDEEIAVLGINTPVTLNEKIWSDQPAAGRTGERFSPSGPEVVK